ncbi:hypothetical protein Tco_1132577 [Tanacetum coccineum]|uniref:Uncharacterized protein n=1 Tax=Tanacetum coccineum TaxID=301880 RepID=A0ABQ5JCA0_9ASTR
MYTTTSFIPSSIHTMMHSISPCRIFITAMCGIFFSMHHRYGCILHSVSAEEKSWARSDITGRYHSHQVAVAAVLLFLSEELTASRFGKKDIAEAENASLRARIKTTEAIEKMTRNREKQARVKIEQQLAAV